MPCILGYYGGISIQSRYCAPTRISTNRSSNDVQSWFTVTKHETSIQTETAQISQPNKALSATPEL